MKNKVIMKQLEHLLKIQSGNNSNTSENNEDDTSKPEPKTTEETIATFSTKIYSTDKARQNNVTITCNTLNDTIVKNRRNFFIL